MKLHVFNPDHDLAMAFGLPGFTAPHAARALRADLGFLPCLWAREGDVVVVVDREHAQRALSRIRPHLRHMGITLEERVELIEEPMLKNIAFDGVEPWGWDSPLKAWLLRKGVSPNILPTDDAIHSLRGMASRAAALPLLWRLSALEGCVGEAHEATSISDVEALMRIYNNKVVVKAPWSGSGRGIRFVDGRLRGEVETWAASVIERQGSVMVEPQYERVADLAMEFVADVAEAEARYVGLSLFSTHKGAFKSSLLATETEKQRLLKTYVDGDLLRKVKETILSHQRGYRGPFGVDMMIVRGLEGKGFLLHPCVEINLRRTMGHVALSISPTEEERSGLMTIDPVSPCRLHITKTIIQ